MNKAIKYTAIASAGVATAYVVYKVGTSKDPGATLVSPVQPLITAASGGSLARWTARNGAAPTNLRDKGSVCRWPNSNGQSGPSTRNMNGLHAMFTSMSGVNANLAVCYCALAAHEAGSTASSCYNFNPYGIHWYRTMEPRAGFLHTDAGVPTMFLAFDSWSESCDYLHNVLLERSEAYRYAKELGSIGDIRGFSRMLGAGGYASVYSRRPDELYNISRSYIRSGYLPNNVSAMLGGNQ